MKGLVDFLWSLNTSSNRELLKSFRKESDVISFKFLKGRFDSTTANRMERKSLGEEAFSRKPFLITISTLIINFP